MYDFNLSSYVLITCSFCVYRSVKSLPAPAGRPPRLCGCCQLLSRQCRSCVAISSYIWLLGLRRLGLLPGRASPVPASHWPMAHSNGVIGRAVRGAPSCDPTDRMFSVSQLHKGPLSRLFVCFFTPSSSAILLLILPVSASNTLSVSELSLYEASLVKAVKVKCSVSVFYKGNIS